jgi:hypothetical protein
VAPSVPRRGLGFALFGALAALLPPAIRRNHPSARQAGGRSKRGPVSSAPRTLAAHVRGLTTSRSPRKVAPELLMRRLERAAFKRERKAMKRSWDADMGGFHYSPTFYGRQRQTSRNLFQAAIAAGRESARVTGFDTVERSREAVRVVQ